MGKPNYRKGDVHPLYIDQDTLQKMLLRIEQRPDGCWMPKGFVNPEYAQIVSAGVTLRYKAIVIKLMLGGDSRMRWVHICGNKWCVAPSHLQLAMLMNPDPNKKHYQKYNEGRRKSKVIPSTSTSQEEVYIYKEDIEYFNKYHSNAKALRYLDPSVVDYLQWHRKALYNQPVPVSRRKAICVMRGDGQTVLFDDPSSKVSQSLLVRREGRPSRSYLRLGDGPARRRGRPRKDIVASDADPLKPHPTRNWKGRDND